MTKYSLAAIGWTIIVLSCIPGDQIPKTFLDEILGIDKLAHLFFYMVMAILWMVHFQLKYRDNRYALVVFMFCTGFGLMMEIFQQQFFKDRTFDWYDGSANAIGVILGIFLFGRFAKDFSIFANPSRT